MSLPARPFASTLRHVRALAVHSGAVTDFQLLHRFVQDRDADAFAELVRRHGPLVLGVARRRLGDVHAAEDVFQATFLALARHARQLRPREPLEGWLYTVAHRLARKEQARAARRPATARVPTTSASPSADPLATVTGRELLHIIDDELAALPVRYRLPLLLCGIDGLARDEAAARLGWTIGALRGRLERGREMLRQRLTKRGLAVPSVVAGVFVTDSASAASPSLIAATSRAALAALTAPATGMSLKAIALGAAFVAGAGGIALLASTSRERERPEVEAPQPPVAHAPGSPTPRVDALGDPLPDGAIARLGSERLRPGLEIHAVAYSHDGKRLTSWTTSDAYQNGRLIIWDVGTGRALRRVDVPNAQIMAMRWLANGHGVAVLRVKADDYYIWDFADPTAPPPPSHPNVVLRGFKYGELMTATVSPDGRWLATGRLAQGEEPRPIEVWELKLNKTLRELSARHLGNQPGHGYQLAFSPDSRKLFALSATKEPNRVQAGPGGVPVVTGGMFAGSARLVTYDVVLGRQLAAFDVPAPHSEDIPFKPACPTFAITPDGRTLVIGRADGTVRICDAASGREDRNIVAHSEDMRRESIGAIALSGDGKTLFAAETRRAGRFWDLASGREIAESQTCRVAMDTVCVSPDGKHLAGGSIGQVAILDFASGSMLSPPVGHVGGVWRVYLRADGKTVLTAGIDGQVIHWDLAGGKELGRVACALRRWWPYFFTADGRYVFGADSTGAKKLLETATGRLQQPTPIFSVKTDHVLAHTADGKAALLFDYENQTLSFRDWPSGDLRRELNLTRGGARAKDPVVMNGGAVSTDGRLAVGVGQEVSLFDATTGQLLHHWNTPDARFEYSVFTPDGAGVVVAGQTDTPLRHVAAPVPTIGPIAYKPDQALQLIDVASGQPIRTFLPADADPQAQRSVTAVAISLDGRQIAAAERKDYSISVFELATGQVRRRLVGHTNWVGTVAFTPNGNNLISGSHDLNALVWDVRLSAMGRVGDKPSAANLERIWADCAKAEWPVAGGALATLAAYPDVAVELIRRKLKPADRAPNLADTVARMVRQLDSQNFGERDRAMAELRRLGSDALPHLRHQVASEPSREVEQRLRRVIRELTGAPVPPEKLRELRAIELLAQVDTIGARDHLKSLAGGAPGAELTRAAADALRRLTQSP